MTPLSAPETTRVSPPRAAANDPMPAVRPGSVSPNRTAALRVALVLRVLLLLVLAGVAVYGLPSAPALPTGEAVWLPPRAASTMEFPVLDSVLIHGAPLVVRADTLPPTAAELSALDGLAGVAPLIVVRPAAPHLVQAVPPYEPRVDRSTGLTVHLLGSPGDTVAVRISGVYTGTDSVPVTLDEGGRGAGVFPIRPTRGGWQEWEIAAGTQRARTGAWVRDATPLRVLAVSGAPTWEANFAIRALEESGVIVERVQPLGRGLQVSGGLTAVPTAAAGLLPFDAVLVFTDAAPGEAHERALDEYAARRGGGVVRTGGAVTQRGSAEVPRMSIRGDEISWSLPAELSSLPSTSTLSEAIPLRAAPGGMRGASAPAGDVLTLQAYGRGRVATLGLLETWRWRMEGGHVDEHRAFWHSLVDWAAAGVRDSVHVRLVAAHGMVGSPVQVHVLISGVGAPSGAGAALRHLRVQRPDGTEDSVPLVGEAGHEGVLLGAFVPVHGGVHTLLVAGAPPAAFHADTLAYAAPDAWARLALLAHGSGGAVVSPESLSAAVAHRSEAMPQRRDRPRPWEMIVFLLVLALTTAEWSVRRLSGAR
ncbi:hypothetical protein BH23GEM3_BH23GEM3_24480 [soil metagenome]